MHFPCSHAEEKVHLNSEIDASLAATLPRPEPIMFSNLTLDCSQSLPFITVHVGAFIHQAKCVKWGCKTACSLTTCNLERPLKDRLLSSTWYTNSPSYQLNNKGGQSIKCGFVYCDHWNCCAVINYNAGPLIKWVLTKYVQHHNEKHYGYLWNTQRSIMFDIRYENYTLQSFNTVFRIISRPSVCARQRRQTH